MMDRIIHRTEQHKMYRSIIEATRSARRFSLLIPLQRGHGYGRAHAGGADLRLEIIPGRIWMILNINENRNSLNFGHIFNGRYQLTRVFTRQITRC
jgi:hypothetical protein